MPCILACSVCGGGLGPMDAETRVAVCEHCDCRQRVPDINSEKLERIIEDAEIARRENRFDQALALYESAFREDPDCANRDPAELWWRMALCEYGIEYVDDPKTGRKVPTCHRANSRPMGESAYVQKAIEAAGNDSSRSIYRDQAEAIDRVLAGVLEMAGKIRPFDVFLSYKETDDAGRRTEDSGIAQDLYTYLSGLGYRVFFSRVSLKQEALGEEYEPVIFAALRSARAMVVLGTQPKYFEAPWVRNEWRRYQELMADHSDKRLFVVYKGMEAYDLPKELKRLQAVDLGGVTALRDLEQNLEKALGKSKTAQSQDPGAGLADQMAKKQLEAFLDALFELIRNGRFDRAEDQLSKIMDAPGGLRSHRFHLGRLMVSLKMKDLAQYPTPITGIEHYAAAMRLGDDSERSALRKIAVAIEQAMLRRQAEALTAGRFEEALELGVAVLEEQCPDQELDIAVFDLDQPPRKLLSAISRGEARAALTKKQPRESSDPLTAPGLDSHGFHQACIGNLKAALRVRDDGELSKVPHPIDGHPWYQRALSLGDDAENTALREISAAVEKNILRRQSESLAAGDFKKALECGEVLLGEQSPDWRYEITLFDPNSTPKTYVSAVDRGEKSKALAARLSSQSYPDPWNAPCLDNHGCYQACVGALKAALRVKSDLAECRHPVDGHPWYQRALSFADGADKAELRETAIRTLKNIMQRQAEALSSGNFSDALEAGEALLGERSSGWDPRPFAVDPGINLEDILEAGEKSRESAVLERQIVEKTISSFVDFKGRSAASLSYPDSWNAPCLDDHEYFQVCVGNLKAALEVGEDLSSCRYPIDSHPWFHGALIFADAEEKAWLEERAAASRANFRADIDAWTDRVAPEAVQDAYIQYLAGLKEKLKQRLNEVRDETGRKIADNFHAFGNDQNTRSEILKKAALEYQRIEESAIGAWRVYLEALVSQFSAMASRYAYLGRYSDAKAQHERCVHMINGMKTGSEGSHTGICGAIAAHIVKNAESFPSVSQNDLNTLFGMLWQSKALDAGHFKEALTSGTALLGFTVSEMDIQPLLIDLDLTPEKALDAAMAGRSEAAGGRVLNIDAFKLATADPWDVPHVNRRNCFQICVGNLKSAYRVRDMADCRLPIDFHPWYQKALAVADDQEHAWLAQQAEEARAKYHQDLGLWMERFSAKAIQDVFHKFVDGREECLERERRNALSVGEQKLMKMYNDKSNENRSSADMRATCLRELISGYRSGKREETAINSGLLFLKTLAFHLDSTARKYKVVKNYADASAQCAKCEKYIAALGPSGDFHGRVNKFAASDGELKAVFDLNKNTSLYVMAKKHDAEINARNFKRSLSITWTVVLTVLGMTGAGVSFGMVGGLGCLCLTCGEAGKIKCGDTFFVVYVIFISAACGAIWAAHRIIKWRNK